MRSLNTSRSLNPFIKDITGEIKQAPWPTEKTMSGPMKSRARKACDFCRRRKIRCSETKMCTNCTRFRQVSCNYSAPVLKRGPKVKDSDVADQSAEDDYIKVEYNTPPPSGSLDNIEVSYRMAYYETSSPIVGSGEYIKPTVANPTSPMPISPRIASYCELTSILSNLNKLNPLQINATVNFFENIVPNFPIINRDGFIVGLSQPYHDVALESLVSTMVQFNESWLLHRSLATEALRTSCVDYIQNQKSLNGNPQYHQQQQQQKNSQSFSMPLTILNTAIGRFDLMREYLQQLK